MIHLDMELIIKDIERLGVKATLEKHYILHGVLNSRLKSMGMSANKIRTKAVLKAWNDGMDFYDIMKEFNIKSKTDLFKFISYRRLTGWYVKDRTKRKRNHAMIQNDWNADVPTKQIMQTYGFKNSSSLSRYVSRRRSKGENFKYKDKRKITRKDSDK